MSQLTKLEEEAREAYNHAVEKMDEEDSRIQALPEDVPDDERVFHDALFAKLEEDVARRKATWDRQIALAKARRVIPPLADDEGGDGDGDGDAARHNRRLSVKEPLVYTPQGPNSYFRDLYSSRMKNDEEARQRLALHGKQMLMEQRDVTTADPGAASFVPPIYLGDQWIDEEVGGRPFADAVPKFPFPERGKTMSFPRVQTAPAAAVQAAEADAVNEVDFDSEDYEVSKVMIAGQNDISIQTLLWSEPSIDTVIMRELVKSYNQQLDSQMLHGTGNNGQHQGLRNVASINSLTFASGGADDLLGVAYEAVAAIATFAPGYEGDTVILHPRRAAWMASHRDANGNLFQQGQLFLAAGGQDVGFVGNVAGLRVIRDSNIQTNLGTNTRDDEMYVVDLGELLLAEGPVRTRVLEEVLSGTLQVRIQLYGESIFAAGRRPKVITRITGAGLTTPVFPST